jgi:hypothetical protein
VEGDGTLLDPFTLHLVLPLSPSRNQMDRWHHSRNLRKLSANAGAARTAVAASLAIAFGTSRWPRPWATRVLLAAARCSTQRRRLDPDGVIGGLKAQVDALVRAELIPDDRFLHVRWGPVEDRIESMWRALPGPATHLLIAILEEPDGTARPELEAMDPILRLLGKGEP